MQRLFLLASLAILVVFTAILDLTAEEKPGAKPYNPAIQPASDDAVKALKRIRVPEHTRIDLFAAEPMLANPVCFCVDEHNRFYVAETFRLHAGVSDIRNHMSWLDDDLACRTVADRTAMMKKYLGKQYDSWAVEHDRIRLLEDTKGTGQADRSTVFADGFHAAEDGIGAGLLARRGSVWFACLPTLWQLKDSKGEGKAEVRKALQTGYGVRVGFLGHDLHGLRMGPDGKLYMSIGDRGLHVEMPGRTVSYTDGGSVLRCNPDGSDLELFAVGLRNPQCLTFDRYGNLFTGDNNADHGDKARWVYLVEGGDSGWRVGYQHMSLPTALGAWNAERLWDPKAASQVGYLVPPIANIADGPSGCTYDPGASLLPERYREHFFLCDFRGGSGGQSGIHSFAVKPAGAGFEMIDRHQCVWGVLATDVGFGMDGALYLTDWVEGWGKPNRGRIYKVHATDRAKDPTVASVRQLMAEGFPQRPASELVKLLEHADIRVRQEAQFALAEKGAEAIDKFAGVLRDSKNQLARLHAIWGLGQVGRKAPAAFAVLMPCVSAPDAEMRSQSAKVLGEGHVAAAYEPLLALLRDPEARVRFFAAISLGKLHKAEAVPAILQLLKDNNDADAFLRHAGVMALVGCATPKSLLTAADDESPAVRMGVLLALRRMGSADVARFLNDREPRLVLEAARAINDVPINGALPALAALTDRSKLSDPLLYRVLNAHFRLGRPEDAIALARFAGRSNVSEALRIEALRELGEWTKPSGRDRVVGLWRPLEPRPGEAVAAALRPALGGIFSGPDKLRQEAAKLAGRFGIKEIGPVLLELLTDKKAPPQVRAEMLLALHVLKDQRLPEAMKLALADADSRVRTAGRRVQATLQPQEAIAGLTTALETGDATERQGAFGILSEMPGGAADALLSHWLDKLLAREVPVEVQLDLLNAATRHATPAIKQQLARFEAARPKSDHLGQYREAIAGGDAEAGRRIFLHKAEVSCVRCHKLKGEGGEVGPDLAGIGARQNREYLLESIVDPNKQIAKGFETVVLGLKNGMVQTGIVKTEDAKAIHLMTADGKLVTVAKDQVEERQTGKSAMPEDIIKQLTKTELRDLVEFLAGLKEGGAKK